MQLLQALSNCLQRGKTPHFCSFCTFSLVESKHLGVTTFKAFQRPQIPFGDKVILLKLSETLETPGEESIPLSASLPDLFWWLPPLRHTFGGGRVPPRGFCMLRCQQLSMAALPYALVPSLPSDTQTYGGTCSPLPINSNTCFFERKI